MYHRLPDEQQSPFAAQIDPLDRPHDLPGLWHKCGFKISNRQTMLSGVFMTQPNGPQQMSGPTHRPSELGPQDMHCLDRPPGGKSDLFPPGGQFVMKQADEMEMMRKMDKSWLTVTIDIFQKLGIEGLKYEIVLK